MKNAGLLRTLCFHFLVAALPGLPFCENKSEFLARTNLKPISTTDSDFKAEIEAEIETELKPLRQEYQLKDLARVQRHQEQLAQAKEMRLQSLRASQSPQIQQVSHTPPSGDFHQNWQSVPWYDSNPNDADDYSMEQLDTIQSQPSRFHLRQDGIPQNLIGPNDLR